MSSIYLELSISVLAIKNTHTHIQHRTLALGDLLGNPLLKSSYIHINTHKQVIWCVSGAYEVVGDRARVLITIIRLPARTHSVKYFKLKRTEKPTFYKVNESESV